MNTTLDPDEFDLDTASMTIIRACPFCGRYPITVCTLNEATEIYGCEVICDAVYCGGSVFANARSREQARKLAIERWEKRIVD
jgi:hypothetical protein